MNNISFEQYRKIDLTILSVLTVVSEGLVTLATDKWFVGVPFAISTSLLFILITMMRWGVYGEPPMNFTSGTVTDGIINANGSEIDITKLIGEERAASYESQKMYFGFRPEAIQLGECKDSFTFTATVQLTELLGDNTNVYVELGGKNVIFKVDPHDTPRLDDTVTFSVPYESAYLFDGKTENVIER